MTWIRAVTLGLAVALAAPVSARAGDLTLRDVIELHHAGVGDEVLLALIEVDGGPFDLEPSAVLDLKAEGLSERVIAALVRAGRRLRVGTNVWAPRELAEPTLPQDAPTQAIVEVPVAVPVYVPVPAGRRRGHDRQGEGYGQAPYTDATYESSLGPRSRPGPRGAARATPSRSPASPADAIRHAPAGFHPGVLGPRAGSVADDRDGHRARDTRATSGGRDDSGARSDAPPASTPGIARSTAGQAPPPGVARSTSRDSDDRSDRSSHRGRPPS